MPGARLTFGFDPGPTHSTDCRTRSHLGTGHSDKPQSPPAGWATWTLCWAALAAAGCGGDARVELSASDSIEALAAGLELTINEYHDDLATGDDLRESAAIAAFVKRIQQAAEDPAEQDRHVAAFTTAIERIRQDRRVEWTRFTAGQDNVDTLREITAGLRRLAVESLTLSDEARRYIHNLIELRRTPPSAKPPQSTARE